jgi:hypothetical protein
MGVSLRFGCLMWLYKRVTERSSTNRGKQSWFRYFDSSQDPTGIRAPARPVLWFVQLCLLVFGQALFDDFKLLKSIHEYGLFCVFLSDTDRRQ